MQLSPRGRRTAPRWLLLLAVLLASLTLADRPHTPSVGPGGVAELTRVSLGGVEQAVLIRGRDAGAPVLLMLHGGPGMPLTYLAHAFQRPLEDDFVVVQWDQRGAGRSQSKGFDYSTLTTSQLLADAKQLLSYLRGRFGDDRLYVLVGHSWGSYLGLLLAHQRPDLVDAYVGVGQVVDASREPAVQLAWLTAEAKRRGDAAALRELGRPGPLDLERWLFRFNAELAHHQSWAPLLVAGLLAPEYSVLDVARVARGSSRSSRFLRRDVLSMPLGEAITKVGIPVTLICGREDWTSPSVMVEEFADRLKAPSVRLLWFEDSAHFPFFEEPSRFHEAMLSVLEEARRFRAVSENTGRLGTIR